MLSRELETGGIGFTSKEQRLKLIDPTNGFLDSGSCHVQSAFETRWHNKLLDKHRQGLFEAHQENNQKNGLLA